MTTFTLAQIEFVVEMQGKHNDIHQISGLKEEKHCDPPTDAGEKELFYELIPREITFTMVISHLNSL